MKEDIVAVPVPNVTERPSGPPTPPAIDRSAPIPRRAPTPVDRARSLWDTVELVIERAIETAEDFEAYDSAGKKNYVTGRALEFLHRMERQRDRIPDAVEPFVFYAIEHTLDWVVERVFRRLAREGRVNAGRAG